MGCIILWSVTKCSEQLDFLTFYPREFPLYMMEGVVWKESSFEERSLSLRRHHWVVSQARLQPTSREMSSFTIYSLTYPEPRMTIRGFEDFSSISLGVVWVFEELPSSPSLMILSSSLASADAPSLKRDKATTERLPASSSDQKRLFPENSPVLKFDFNKKFEMQGCPKSSSLPKGEPTLFRLLFNQKLSPISQLSPSLLEKKRKKLTSSLEVDVSGRKFEEERDCV